MCRLYSVMRHFAWDARDYSTKIPPFAHSILRKLILALQLYGRRAEQAHDAFDISRHARHQFLDAYLFRPPVA